MPTVLRVGSMRFFFYAADGFEPPHVHVEDNGATAKIWLRTVTVARAGKFGERRLAEAVRIVQEHWDEYFGA
jgi:hypothetical protein